MSKGKFVFRSGRLSIVGVSAVKEGDVVEDLKGAPRCSANKMEIKRVSIISVSRSYRLSAIFAHPLEDIKYIVCRTVFCFLSGCDALVFADPFLLRLPAGLGSSLLTSNLPFVVSPSSFLASSAVAFYTSSSSDMFMLSRAWSVSVNHSTPASLPECFFCEYSLIQLPSQDALMRVCQVMKG